MRATWLYAFASVFLLATDCPPVTASRYAVIPRQNDRSSQATTSTAVALPSATSQASAQSSSAPATTSSISVSASDKATSGAAQGTSNTSSASATASGSPTSASVVLGPTGTPIANTTLNGTTTYAPTIEGLPIRPKITPALSVAGALLILTGTFYTLVGIKTKWLHIFLSTAYLFSLAVTVLIIYVMHPPISNAIQGAYFAAACVTGLVFGAVAVVFSDVTEGLGCFLGGFCLAMWFLVLKSGGIITSTAGKAIFIACFTVGTFGLYISHHTRPYGLIGSTSFAGATVVVLGIDCFSRAGLKEFWLYVWSEWYPPVYFPNASLTKRSRSQCGPFPPSLRWSISNDPRHPCGDRLHDPYFSLGYDVSDESLEDCEKKKTRKGRGSTVQKAGTRPGRRRPWKGA